MPLPVNHTLNTVYLNAYSGSVGASPVGAVMRVPFRSRLITCSCTLNGTLTTDATVTVAIAGTTVFTFTVTASGSNIGSITEATPPSPLTTYDPGVPLTFTASGGGGANIPATFQAAFRRA